MATISPNNTERVAVPNSTADVAIPNSSKYTKFLFCLEGCTATATYQIVADLGAGGAGPVPLEILPTVSNNMNQGRWGSEVTVANPPTTVTFQVTLAAPCPAGLILRHSGGADNAVAGTLHASMSGSVYSQGLN